MVLASLSSLGHTSELDKNMIVLLVCLGQHDQVTITIQVFRQFLSVLPGDARN